MSQKVILVTGASSGIGKATALHLINEGHIVYGAARRLEKMKDLVSAGGNALKMDITNEDQIDECVETIINKEGKIDVLINNAGYAVYGPVEEVTMADAKRQFEVNIFGLASITQKIIPHMRKANAGKIINITSVGGKIYTPFGAWYHATKHALEGWSDCLRLELKEFGIDVVIVEPGIIGTEFADVVYQPMVDRSSGGPYAKTTNIVAETTKAMFTDEKAYSPPSVIAKVISKAIRTKNPKTRYAKGKMAKMLLFTRKWLTDRLFDKLLYYQINKLRKNN